MKKTNRNHVHITISIPKELDKLINTLVAESKNTANPLSKSKLFAVSAYEYLANSLKILDSQDTKEIN